MNLREKIAQNPMISKKEAQIIAQYQKIFDGFVELVYIMDLETKELYFLNKAGRVRFQEEHYHHKKCYQVLHGLKEPCSFCPNAHISQNAFYEWDVQNDKINRHVMLKDLEISWFGRPAKLEIAYDVTESERQLIALGNAYEVEQLIVECVRKLYEAKDPTEAIHTVLGKTGEFLIADRTYVFELENTHIISYYEWCAEGITSTKQVIESLDSHLFDNSEALFREEEKFIIVDAEDLKEYDVSSYTILKQQGVQRMMMVPLYQQGRFIGCIGADNPDPDKLNAFSILDSLGYFIALSFEKMETQKAMVEYSYVDGLTGLYNRNRYLQDLEFYQQNNINVYGVVYLDINDLKGVNDRQGHSGGDALIIEAAGYLRQVFEEEHAYRIGGDEFIVLIKHMKEQEVEEHLWKLRNLFALSKTCSAAIGAIYQEDGNLNEMVKKADEQMYENKKEYYRTHIGNGRYRSLYDETLHLQLPDEVKKAIHEQQFVVYLQPKASIDLQEVIGSEALVRFIDHVGTLVPPDQFIPMLEHSHTIHYVDFFVFETVCQHIALWRKEHRHIQPISVNFSRYTLMLDDFLNQLEEIWARYQIPKSLLEIEIIERAENISSDYLIKVMQEVKQLGFRVSIDDFGVKYSNLFLFTNTNIDTLKLDRSLINDVITNQKSQMIIDALSKLCTNMGIQLIVEGVETKEQLEILQQLHCDGIQGYLFSRPIPIEEFEQRYVKTMDTV